MLCCAAQCQAPRAESQTLKTAATLSKIIAKVRERGLYTDNQWSNRIGQLVQALAKRDRALGTAYAAMPALIPNDELPVAKAFSPDVQKLIKQRIREEIKKQPHEAWDADLVRYAIPGDIDSNLRDSLRKASEFEPLRSVCMQILAEDPKSSEYDLFLQTLESPERSYWIAAWKGLQQLPNAEPTREFLILSKLISASLNTNLQLPRKEIFTRTRQVAQTLQKPNPPTSEKWKDWEIYFTGQTDESQRTNWVYPAGQVDLGLLTKQIQETEGKADRGRQIGRAHV